MKPIRYLPRRIVRRISRVLHRRGILSGQVLDTRTKPRATTMIRLPGPIIEHLSAEPGISEGPPSDWLSARTSARTYNNDEGRRRWIVRPVLLGSRR
jgi:hypothetical protein